MNYLEIKNFGPIKEGYCDNVMPISPITIICGNQGTGKSTIAKLISLFSWMEKAFVRGDYSVNKKTEVGSFLRQHCSYHRIHNYFQSNTEFHFYGQEYDFHYWQEQFAIKPKGEKTEYLMPKIMYIPAERNILSVVEHPEILKEIPESLFSMYSEFDKARKAIKKDSPLPIKGYAYRYDQLNNTSWLVNDDMRVKVSEAASGFQSLIPLSLVVRYMTYLVDSGQSTHIDSEQQQKIDKRVATILADDSITEDLRKLLISQLSESTKYRRTINIVEEPEQNLYPSAQKDVLYSLFTLFNIGEATNNLIITTHSPYLIDYATLAIKAQQVVDSNPDLDSKVEPIVPEKARIKAEDLSVYQIEDGRILPLDTFDGMPSDHNMLNQELNNTNELFAQLLDM